MLQRASFTNAAKRCTAVRKRNESRRGFISPVSSRVIRMKGTRGLKNVFDEAILAALEPPETKPKKRCSLL